MNVWKIITELVDFRTGAVIIMSISHTPLTVTIRNIADELGKGAAEINIGLMRNGLESWKKPRKDLKDFKEKNDDEKQNKVLKSRERYEKIVENKKATW